MNIKTNFETVFSIRRFSSFLSRQARPTGLLLFYPYYQKIEDACTNSRLPRG